MLRIRAIASHVPDTAPFQAVQAREKNIGYGHLLYKSAVFSMPRGKGRIDAEETLRLLPTASIELPVAPPVQSGADLALEAVALLREQIPADTLAQVTHIVVTNAALNQRINESVAGRIQHALGLPKALPFAIGQSGTAGVFNALSMIEALVSLGGKVLLVASDKWLYPFFRAWGDLVVYGDGAAAILLDGEGQASPGWGVIRASAMHYGAAIDNPWGLTPAALAERLHPLAVFSDSFTLGVSRELGIAQDRHFEFGARPHHSSAAPLLSLLRLRASLPPGKTATVLLWDAALCGTAGAIVAEIQAGA